jgi:hypothetical protein
LLVKIFTSPIATPPPTITKAVIGILIKNHTTPAHAPRSQEAQRFAKSQTRRKKARSIKFIQEIE